jgi:hypothetical protein
MLALPAVPDQLINEASNSYSAHLLTVIFLENEITFQPLRGCTQPCFIT